MTKHLSEEWGIHINKMFNHYSLLLMVFPSEMKVYSGTTSISVDQFNQNEKN